MAVKGLSGKDAFPNPLTSVQVTVEATVPPVEIDLV